MTPHKPTESDIWVAQWNVAGAVKFALLVLTEFKRQQNK